MTYPSLLPSNRSEWATAISETGAARYPLPAELVASVWSPATCPAHILPYLAWALSVDLWDEAWPEVKKREVCRRALDLHRLKTTPAGIKQHVEIAGSKVLRTIRPPAVGFMYPSMTEAQKTQWLAGLAQIRLYPFFRRMVGIKSRAFYSGPAGRNFHANRTYATSVEGYYTVLGVIGQAVTEVSKTVSCFARSSRGLNLYGRRATYWDRGVERDLNYEIDSFGGTIERVYVTRSTNRSFLAAGRFGGFMANSRGSEGVLTLALAEDSGRFAISPSLSPVDVRPERVLEGRTVPVARGYLGTLAGSRFMKTSFGPLMIYDKVSIHDASRLGGRRKARNYYGHARFGIADYTAELLVRVPMTRHRRRAGRWWKAGFMKAADMTPLNRAIEAVRVSKAFRDTVLIDTTTYRVINIGQSPKLGSFRVGALKEVV